MNPKLQKRDSVLIAMRKWSLKLTLTATKRLAAHTTAVAGLGLATTVTVPPKKKRRKSNRKPRESGVFPFDPPGSCCILTYFRYIDFRYENTKPYHL